MNISQLIPKIAPVDISHAASAQERLDSLTKPPGSLGRIEEFASALVSIFGGRAPAALEKKVFVFAGDHGVTAEGVSAYPAEVTTQMVLNFLRGGAAINVLARHADTEVVVVDAGVKNHVPQSDGLVLKKAVRGTRNMVLGPAMTGEEAAASVAAGMETLRENLPAGDGIVAVGEMGIGNTTAAAAITAVITGASASDVAGRGTGIDDDGLFRKISTIEKAIRINGPDGGNPADILAKVGGAEIGAIAGLCLEAASRGIPVVIDGFITTAGAAIACGLAPEVKGYLFASHLSQEKGHRLLLDHLGLKPILDLDLRLGEGTGAVLALPLIESGLHIYREMSTFQEAGVEESTS